jgi:hypothetical protein
LTIWISALIRAHPVQPILLLLQLRPTIVVYISAVSVVPTTFQLAPSAGHGAAR